MSRQIIQKKLSRLEKIDLRFYRYPEAFSVNKNLLETVTEIVGILQLFVFKKITLPKSILTMLTVDLLE